MFNPTNRVFSKAQQKAIEQGKVVESINALSFTEFIQQFDLVSATLEANTKLSYKSGRDLKVNLLFAQAMRKEHKDVLDACLRLIEQSSAADYKASEIKWSHASKRKEMVLPDMRYLIVREAPGTSPEGTTDVQKEKSNICGFVSFMVTYEDSFEVVYVYEIHLSPDFRGQGIGNVLMQMAEEIGRKAGVEKCMLTVFKANDKALKWYYRCGYVIDDFSPGPRVLRNGTVKEPSYLILSKQLRHSPVASLSEKCSVQANSANSRSVTNVRIGDKHNDCVDDC